MSPLSALREGVLVVAVALDAEERAQLRAEGRALLVAIGSGPEGERTRSTLRLDALARRGERARGLDREALEVAAELDAQRIARGLSRLNAIELDGSAGAISFEASRLNATYPAGYDREFDPASPGPRAARILRLGGAARAPSTSLEFLGITGQGPAEPSGPPAPRACFLDSSDPYLREVERETADFRIGRARRYRERAYDVASDAPAAELPPELAEGVEHPRSPSKDGPPTWALASWDPVARLWRIERSGNQLAREHLDRVAKRRTRARWNLARARGSEERFPRVRDCGDKQITATCVRSCGASRVLPCRCAVGRLCIKCRGKAARLRKRRFETGRSSIVARLRRDGLLSKYRGALQWSEKFLTLTVPHVSLDAIEGAREGCEGAGIAAGSMIVGARIRLLFKAWRYFSRKLQAWGRKVFRLGKGRARVGWYRAFEWTPGDDGGGHPHFHLWIVCPFLNWRAVSQWWSDALASAGLPGVDPILDVHAWRTPRPGAIGRELLKGARGARNVVEYVEGWSIVDTIAGSRISPEVAARLYESLDGLRLVQTSRGLLVPVMHACPHCGAVGAVDVRMVREGEQAPETHATGPPALAGPTPRLLVAF